MITEKSGCTFIENTVTQRNENRAEMLTGDDLHPSGNEYVKWSEKLAELIFLAHSP